MADPTFQDLLAPGETVVAQLAANGADRSRWQLALTPERLLVVRLRAVPGGGDRWDVVSRVAGPRGSLRVTHFPRTPASDARLAIDGCGDHIVLVGVDQPPLYTQVEAFLRAWGGPVAGGETLAHSEPDEAPADDKTLLYVAGAGAAMFLLCCGCSGVATVARLVIGWVG